MIGWDSKGKILIVENLDIVYNFIIKQGIIIVEHLLPFLYFNCFFL